MKKFYLIISMVFSFAGCKQKEENSAEAQTATEKDTTVIVIPTVSNFTAPDQSPMDMIYCPSDYPLKKMAGAAANLPYARVIYSRPQTQGRKIFGELVKYDQPWRMGANEATELELFSTATIQNKTIGPGRYILYCIPTETNWTIIFNENIYSWGLHPDMKKNIIQFEVPVEINNSIIDYFTLAFENTGPKANLLILWDDIKVSLPINF